MPAGTLAPPFMLPDEDGSVFLLYANKGKNIVLVFYPADDTPGCTAQLCEFRDRWDKLREKGIEVYGVNPGPAASHLRFREKYKFPFPLLVDNGKRVASLYKAGGLIVKRTVYLIDRSSVIRYAKRGKPHPDEVIAAAE